MSDLLTEMSKLKNDLAMQGDWFRELQTRFARLDADQSSFDKLTEAHAVLEKSVNAWKVARKAALDNKIEDAKKAATESRKLLGEAKAKLAAIKVEPGSAEQPSAPAPAPSSPEPKPTPPAARPTPPVVARPAAQTPSPAPTAPKKAEAPPSAQADDEAAKGEASKPIDLDAVKSRKEDEKLHRALNEKFGTIDKQISDLSGANQANQFLGQLFASGDYEPQDLLLGLKAGRALRKKSFTLKRGKHSNSRKDDETSKRDDEKKEDRPGQPESDSSNPHPPTKAMNLAADEKARPKHERN
jgi:hypothetical protein